MTNNDEMLRIRLSTELKNELIKLAEKDKRKLSDFIRLELMNVVQMCKKKK